MRISTCIVTGSVVLRPIAIPGQPLASPSTPAMIAIPPTTTIARGSLPPRVQLRTPSTSAANSSAASASAPATRSTRKRLSRSRSARSHASGTNTKRPLPVTSPPPSRHLHARLAPRPDGDLRVHELERPVSARRALLLLGGDELQRVRVEPESIAQFARGQCERRRAVRLVAGAAFGQQMADLAHAAGGLDGHPPFLGPVDDIAVERRVADFPQRRCERRADERAVRCWAGLLPDELVPRPLRRFVRRRGAHPNSGATSAAA